MLHPKQLNNVSASQGDVIVYSSGLNQWSGELDSGIHLPQGTSASRPVPVSGTIRFNETGNTIEYTDGTNWYSVIPLCALTSAGRYGVVHVNSFGLTVSGHQHDWILEFHTSSPMRMEIFPSTSVSTSPLNYVFVTVSGDFEERHYKNDVVLWHPFYTIPIETRETHEFRVSSEISLSGYMPSRLVIYKAESRYYSVLSAWDEGFLFQLGSAGTGMFGISRSLLSSTSSTEHEARIVYRLQRPIGSSSYTHEGIKDSFGEISIMNLMTGSNTSYETFFYRNYLFEWEFYRYNAAFSSELVYRYMNYQGKYYIFIKSGAHSRVFYLFGQNYNRNFFNSIITNSAPVINLGLHDDRTSIMALSLEDPHNTRRKQYEILASGNPSTDRYTKFKLRFHTTYLPTPEYHDIITITSGISFSGNGVQNFVLGRVDDSLYGLERIVISPRRDGTFIYVPSNPSSPVPAPYTDQKTGWAFGTIRPFVDNNAWYASYSGQTVDAFSIEHYNDLSGKKDHCLRIYSTPETATYVEILGGTTYYRLPVNYSQLSPVDASWTVWEKKTPHMAMSAVPRIIMTVFVFDTSFYTISAGNYPSAPFVLNYITRGYHPASPDPIFINLSTVGSRIQMETRLSGSYRITLNTSFRSQVQAGVITWNSGTSTIIQHILKDRSTGIVYGGSVVNSHYMHDAMDHTNTIYAILPKSAEIILSSKVTRFNMNSPALGSEINVKFSTNVALELVRKK